MNFKSKITQENHKNNPVDEITFTVLGLIEYYGKPGVKSKKCTIYHVNLFQKPVLYDKTNSSASKFSHDTNQNPEEALIYDFEGSDSILPNSNFIQTISFRPWNSQYSSFSLLPKFKADQYTIVENETYKVSTWYFRTNDDKTFNLQENYKLSEELKNLKVLCFVELKEIKFHKINTNFQYLKFFNIEHNFFPHFSTISISLPQSSLSFSYDSYSWNNLSSLELNRVRKMYSKYFFLKNVYKSSKEEFISTLHNRVSTAVRTNTKMLLEDSSNEITAANDIELNFYMKYILVIFDVYFYTWIYHEAVSKISSKYLPLYQKLEISKILYNIEKEKDDLNQLKESTELIIKQKIMDKIILAIDFIDSSLNQKKTYFDSILSYQDSSININTIIGFLNKIQSTENSSIDELETDNTNEDNFTINFFETLSILKVLKEIYSTPPPAPTATASNSLTNTLSSSLIFSTLINSPCKVPIYYDAEESAFVLSNYKNINWSSFKLKSFMLEMNSILDKDINDIIYGGGEEEEDTRKDEEEPPHIFFLNKNIQQKFNQKTTIRPKIVFLLEDNCIDDIEFFVKKNIFIIPASYNFEYCLSNMWKRLNDKSSISKIYTKKPSIIVIRLHNKEDILLLENPQMFEEKIINNNNTNKNTTYEETSGEIPQSVWKSTFNPNPTHFFPNISILVIDQFEKSFEIESKIRETQTWFLNIGKRTYTDTFYFFKPCCCTTCKSIWTKHISSLLVFNHIYSSPKVTIINNTIIECTFNEINKNTKPKTIYLNYKDYNKFCSKMKEIISNGLKHKKHGTIFDTIFTKVLVTKDVKIFEEYSKEFTNKISIYTSEKLYQKDKKTIQLIKLLQ